MKVVFNCDNGTKKAGDVIEINPYYVKDLLAKGIVSPIGTSVNPIEPKAIEAEVVEKPIKKRSKK